MTTIVNEDILELDGDENENLGNNESDTSVKDKALTECKNTVKMFIDMRFL